MICPSLKGAIYLKEQDINTSEFENKNNENTAGRIILEDGTIFEGESFGSLKTICGEIVFNTGMTGYQEILTDPSYAGQIVTMTYPLIGNYGINEEDIESDKIQVSGFIVKEYSELPNHWQSQMTLKEYLKKNEIPAISGVDTRMLTKKIRNKGTMKCILTTEEVSNELLNILDEYEFPNDIVSRVSSLKKQIFPGKGKKIGVIDLGLKQGIVEQLLNLGCHVTVFPYNVTSKEILNSSLDALLLSNGPGDPKDNESVIKTVKEIKGKLPLWGICLGNQILALALGANTYKLKFGHRGANHPVIDLETGKVFMSSQNHGYAVEKDSLTEGVKVTHYNVNDDTVEGIACSNYQIKAVQFHPEEGPGPEDAHNIFEKWLNSL